MVNIEHSLGKALGFTLRMFTKKLQEMFDREKLPISVEQFVMLNIIHHHQANNITQIELANYIGKDKSAILRHLDFMEGLKLLGRVEDINDRRKKTLHLTNKGNDILIKARKIEQNLSSIVMKDMTHPEIEKFIKTMDHILANIIELENS
jgi:DNA-binding MarR family transcriptional regulator